METKKCVGPLHKGEQIDILDFGKNQNVCRDCKHEYHRKRYTLRASGILEYGKKWKTANKEYVSKYNKAWRERNKERIKGWNKIYMSSFDNRLVHNIKKRIFTAFGFRISRKDIPEYLGCGLVEYITYLKSRFTPGMGWKNYGSGRRYWQIDHIIPLSSIDKGDPVAIKKALHYTNTRPFWSRDNQVKGAKMPSPLSEPEYLSVA